MSTLHETHDEIVSRVIDEQRVLHGGVSDGVEHFGRKELEAAALALGVGLAVALALGIPQHWSLVMSAFIGFAAAIGTFLVASIVLVETDDGRVSEQALGEVEHATELRAQRFPWRAMVGRHHDRHGAPAPEGVNTHPGASAGAISRWVDDGGSTSEIRKGNQRP